MFPKDKIFTGWEPLAIAFPLFCKNTIFHTFPQPRLSLQLSQLGPLFLACSASHAPHFCRTLLTGAFPWFLVTNLETQLLQWFPFINLSSCWSRWILKIPLSKSNCIILKKSFISVIPYLDNKHCVLFGLHSYSLATGGNLHGCLSFWVNTHFIRTREIACIKRHV